MDKPNEHPKSIEPNQAIAQHDRARKIAAIETVAAHFTGLLSALGDSVPGSGTFASRELSLAATKIDEAVLWATKHVTK